MSKVLIAFLTFALIASLASADSTVTLKSAGITDWRSLCFTQQPDATVTLSFVADVKDTTGKVQRTAIYTRSLTTAQVTSINTFITNTVLAGFNAQEGL